MTDPVPIYLAMVAVVLVLCVVAYAYWTLRSRNHVGRTFLTMGDLTLEEKTDARAAIVASAEALAKLSKPAVAPAPAPRKAA